MNSLILKRHNSFQNKDKKKSTHNFALKPLIYNPNHTGEGGTPP